MSYGFPLPLSEKESYLWILPLSLLPKPIDTLNIDVRLAKTVQGVSSPNLDEGLKMARHKDKASIVLVSPEVCVYRSVTGLSPSVGGQGQRCCTDGTALLCCALEACVRRGGHFGRFRKA